MLPKLFKPTSPQVRSMGGAATQISAGRINDLDPNIDLRNEFWYGTPYQVGISSKMMRDSHVRRSYNAIVDPIVSATWAFKPVTKDPKDVEIADFCSHVFLERLDWAANIRKLCSFIRDGFSFLEVEEGVAKVDVKRFPLHTGAGQANVIKSFHARPAWSVDRWVQSSSDPTKIDGIIQFIPGSDGEESGFVEIPGNRLIRFTWEQEGANFAGLAPLRSAYGPWKVKTLLMIVESIRHEREHTGVPTLRLPEGASEDDVTKAETILAELRANAKSYLMLPFGYEFLFSTTNSTTDIGTTIERCNFDIAHNLAVGFMLLGKAGTSGSYALASTQSGQYEITLDNYVSFISNGFNIGQDGWSIVERIVRMNYGEDVGIPKLVARNMPTRDYSKILPIIHNLTTSNVIRPDDQLEAFVRDVTYLPPMDLSTVREKPELEPQTLKTDGVTNNEIEDDKDEPKEADV